MGWGGAFFMVHPVSATVAGQPQVWAVQNSAKNLGKFTPIPSFSDLGFIFCGPAGRFTVDVMIVLSQAGFCVSYLIFIANTLTYVFNCSTKCPSGENFLGMSLKAVYIWGCFPFQLGLNSIPTLTHLAPMSIFADVVDLGAMGVVMVEDVMIFLQRERPVLQAFGGFSVFLYGLGVAVYTFSIFPRNGDGWACVVVFNEFF